MTTQSLNIKDRMMAAAVGRATDAIAENQITAQWININGDVIANWDTVTRSFNDVTNVVTYSGAQIKPDAPGDPDRQRIIFSSSVDLQTELTVNDNANVPITNNSVQVNDDISFTYTSTLRTVAGLTLSDACIKRIQRAACGLGSSELANVSYRLWDGTQTLVSWETITFSFDRISGTNSAALASGTPTNFQMVTNGVVDIDVGVGSLTILDEQNQQVSSLNQGDVYRLDNVYLFI